MIPGSPAYTPVILHEPLDEAETARCCDLFDFRF